ncbi:DNA-3-methyladenine glycosylase [Propionibacteriaceae bacterium Y1685]
MLPLEAWASRPVTEVAVSLLGSTLRHGPVTVRITEVEAYAGESDPASHAHRGPTPRTRVMFGAPGRLYVYRSHGLHWCANIVCGPDGLASAVLLRGADVIAGEAEARTRRGGVPYERLARGPGNLASALGLTGTDSGALLSRAPLGWTAAHTPVGQVQRGPRVGVSGASEREWRFWLAGEPSVSAYRRSARAQPG